MISMPADENERMVALKKAYAEMILNTSKEAAVRIMVAERKAQKFEQDLLSVKGEAVRMLLRMKQMIDFKNREAEITSINEKRKINELEAQLDEAEGVIVDLRAELSLVQDQLDDMKSKYKHSLRRAEKVVFHSQDKIFETKQSDFAPVKPFSKLESKISEVLASTSEHSIFGPESFVSAKETSTPNPVLSRDTVDEPLASARNKSNETELFTNRFTQRNSEFETELVDVKLNSTDEMISLLENKSEIVKEEENKMIHPMPTHKTGKFNELDISILQAAFLEDKPADDQPVKLRKVCKQRTCYRRTKAASRKYKSGHVVNPRRTTFATSPCKSRSHATNHVRRPGCVSTIAMNTNETDYACRLEANEDIVKSHNVSVMRRSVRKRKIKKWDGFATSCKLNVSHSCHYDDPGQTDKSSDKLCKALPEVEDGGGKPKETPAITTTCISSVRSSTSLGDSMKKDHRLLNNSTISDKQHELTSDLELEDASWALSDTKDIKTSTTSCDASSQSYSNMPLKYTFFRKRKMPLSNIAEINSLQEKSMKKRSGKETGKVLLPDSGHCVHESSKDGRRLVQVAHQLISLSGKRW